jgi:glyoxylase-like metal-dependent hydrolase (beta-lactamase superfamily II)
MGVSIYPIQLGFDCCYIIQDKGTIMIDGGTPGKIKAFMKGIGKLSIRPEQIKLIVITHGHWDHISSVKDIKEKTGAKIAIHEKEKEWLEKGLKPMPPGVNLWGRFLSKAMTMCLPLIKVPAAPVDIVIGNEGFSLAEYGISGSIIHTPGHSSGSVSVLLDTGDFFVGDMAMNEFPLSLRPGFPVFAEDYDKLKESWRKLLDQGAKTVYPSHGKPFPASIIRNLLS